MFRTAGPGPRRGSTPRCRAFRSRNDQIVRVPGARPLAQAHQPRHHASDRQLAVFLRQGRSRAHRAAGLAHHRRHPRQRNLCRPIRVRGKGRRLRLPLAVRDDPAVRGLGSRALRLRLAAPSARRPVRHHPRQCPRAGRRMDHAQPLARRRRLAPRRGRAARHLLAEPGAAGARRCRRAVLSPLPAQPDRAGAPSAAYRIGRRATASRDCRPRSRSTYAALCMARQQRHVRGGDAATVGGAGAADSPRRRPYQPQPRRADRASGRSTAAAHGVHRPQPRAAAGAAQRHRPHDADAALLPARRRQFRVVQRHGTHADRSGHHHPGL